MTCRVFFALWPDDDTRARLGKLQSRFADGRRIPASNFHLTLAFLGEQPAERVAALRSFPMRWTGFDCMLTLDKLGYFARQRVIWAGCTAAPDCLLQLQEDLMAAVDAQGITLPERAAVFIPHVSLLRNAVCVPSPEMPAIRWRAQKMVLAQSVTGQGGVCYRVLAES